MIRAVVLDIEGTTSSLRYVREHLFPYSRRRAGAAIRSASAALLAQRVRDAAGRPDASLDEVAAILVGWIDADVKAAPLKELQGRIWAEGFAAGELTAHVYPDVPGALGKWHAWHVPAYVYSSGSEQAQREWFGHTQYGDLRRYLAGHFDLTTAGPKHDPASYQVIAERIGVPGASIAFYSDSPAELAAAAAAGWHAVAVRRPEDGTGPVPGFPTVSSLSDSAATAAPQLRESAEVTS